MRDASSHDAETIFIVRVVTVAALVGLLPVFLIAGVAKLVVPSYDAGGVALGVGWPLGFLAVAAAACVRRKRRV